MIASKKISLNLVLEISFAIFLSIIFVAFSSLGVNLNPSLVMLLIIIILLIYPTQSNVIKIMGLIYSILFLILIRMNLIRFDFIPQARVLLENNESIFYWFSVGHVHAIRLLVVYPAYLISEIYTINLDLGFTYFGMMLFIFIYLNISNTIAKLQNHHGKLSRDIKYIILIVPLLILPLIMNGRLILSYLGYTILIDLYTNLFLSIRVKKIKAILITILGLVMTMVSSGTMAVAILYISTMLYAINHENFNKKKFLKTALVLLFFLAPLLYKVLVYTTVMINRNINFYGGGFQGAINMLNHGVGKYFNSSNEILLIFSILAFVIFIFNYKYLKNKINRRDRLFPVLLGVNIAVYGLLFGFSTGSMMIPPLIIYILVKSRLGYVVSERR